MSHQGNRSLFAPLDEDALKSASLMSPGFKSPGFKSPGLLKSPTRQGLFLNKSLLGNGSSTSINEMPHTPNGLRAQLGHLLPKHAYFRARVVIHQISSVPYVGGEFGVRWKFKGVQMPSSSKQGLLDRVKGRTDTKRTTSNRHHGNGDKAQDAMSPTAGDDAQVHVVSPGGSRSDVNGSTHTGASSSSNSKVQPPTRVNTFSSLSSSMSSHTSSATDTTHLSEWGTSSSHPSAATSNSSTITTVPATTSKSNSGTTTPDAIPPSSTPARGMTNFLPLKEHSVAWSQTLDTTLKFDIDRESSHILANPLKLVVMQRVIPGDPHGNPQNPRLGAVYLNLAEYVGQGSVERRYLLKESKTNATLKLTIELEHISGETHYIAPPLAKGEILTGLAGFLEKDAVKQRPRALDLYGPYRNQEELETDVLAGLKSPARPRTARSERRVAESAEHTETETEDESHDHNHDTTSFEDNDTNSMGSGGNDPANMGVAFDVQRLPVAYGTKTTEMLIEALFNPVKVSDKKEESPFTIYEPSSPRSHKTHSSVSSSPYLSAGVTPRMPAHPGVRPSGLGPTGVSEDRRDMTATIGRRQNSVSADMSSSWTTTTTSDSASDQSSGASTSRKKILHGGRPGGSHSLGGSSVMVVARSTPEGRVVVDHHPRDSTNASTATIPQHHDDSSMNGGGVRGWWKRTITKPGHPTRTAAHA
ncbi:hypothetical protein CPB83DRAFT_849338 [Crepidotus variabilis]|uniref:C2 NT-type domain-containing protein n=1 Tax=Crepidotus variabilis TaxID=179855 RepID=A0A9P6JSA1_9AGAR|nr:hypothetical protein CPB83DRAFT_849338 [Crepidotus variabilis]